MNQANVERVIEFPQPSKRPKIIEIRSPPNVFHNLTKPNNFSLNQRKINKDEITIVQINEGLQMPVATIWQTNNCTSNDFNRFLFFFNKNQLFYSIDHKSYLKEIPMKVRNYLVRKN
jgi:hypothetical protein